MVPSAERSPSTTVRLADLVALLSLGTDLGLGQPMEHMIRACPIALRLGEQVGLDASSRLKFPVPNDMRRDLGLPA